MFDASTSNYFMIGLVCALIFLFYFILMCGTIVLTLLSSPGSRVAMKFVLKTSCAGFSFVSCISFDLFIFLSIL